MNNNKINLRLDGIITLLSPLSHIGESLGPDSYLSTDIILTMDGKPIEVFVYSGNAFRGMLRDCGTKYMFDKCGIKVTLPAHHLMFSGGNLGGSQTVDIDQARKLRKAAPIFSIVGGGVGNQILPGKIKMGALYPLVKECQRVLPQYLRDPEAPSWKQWTFEKSFTRMDDSKNDNLRVYLDEENTVDEKKNKNDQAQQMRYSVELLAAGSKLYQRINLCNFDELELGAFVSALVEFSQHPYIGGKSGTGHGLVNIEYTYRYTSDKEPRGEFLHIKDDGIWLSEIARSALDKYDTFLSECNPEELKEILQMAAGEKSATD